MKCPNISSPEWKELEGKVGKEKALYLYHLNGEDIPTIELADKLLGLNEIGYNLKTVELLQSERADQIFEKGSKNNWTLSKVLDEIGGFGKRTGYKDLFTQEQLDSNVKDLDREELILDIASKYNYTIEINTAKTKEKNIEESRDGVNFNIDGDIYRSEFTGELDFDEFGGSPVIKYTKNGEVITEEEFLKQRDKATNKPSKYYSNLTVLGGTNYTENEISTPLIIPSIKGHAQFSTDNGIGWFRSDDKTIEGTFSKETKLDDINIEDIPNEFQLGETRFYLQNNEWYMQNEDSATRMREVGLGEPEVLIAYKSMLLGLTEIDNNLTGENYRVQNNTFGTPTKTRRILEVQSDLFQKGRDRENLAGVDNNLKAKGISKEEAVSRTIPQNNFLQLLNKDNNWVTFFIKSVVQDSAKKGYEKVLFPLGDTASKIEGHETLKDFKHNKEMRISDLELALENTEDVTDIEKINTEIKQLKQELERVEGPEGFGALKPIYNFYENTISNILKKNYTVNEITDEYNNKWLELSIDSIDNLIISLSPSSSTEEQNRLLKDSIGLIGNLTARKQNDLVTAIAQSIDQAIKLKRNSIEDVFKEWYTTLSNLEFNDRDSILNDWLKLKKTVLNKLEKTNNIVFNDNVNVEGYEDVDSIIDKNSWNDEGSLQIDPKDGISGQLKSIFSFLSTGERGYLGQPRFVESDTIMNTVLAITNDIDPDFNQLILALNEHTDSHSWMSELIQKLGEQPTNIKNQFVVFASKHYAASKAVLMKKNEDGSVNLKVIDVDQNSLVKTIQSDWIDNIKDKPIVKKDIEGNQILDPEIRKELVNEFKEISKDPTIESLNNWLNKIGIEISPKTLEYIKNNSSQSKELNNLTFNQLFTSTNSPLYYMVKKLDSNEKSSQRETVELNNPLYDNSGVRVLAKLESQFTERYYSSSWKNGENNTVYAYSVNKYFTQKFRNLKNNNKLLSGLSNISFSKYSTWLDKLKTSQSFKDGFNYFYVDVIREQKKGKKGKKLKDQSNREHEVTKLALFQNSNNPLANFLYLTMSNKTTMLGVSAERFEWKEFNGLLHKDSIDNLFDNLIRPEYQRILSFQKKKREGTAPSIDGYSQGAEKFIMFPYLNDKNRFDIWAGDTLRDLNSDIQSMLKDHLQEVIGTLTNNKLEEWKNLGIINNEGTKANYFDKNYERFIETKVENKDSKKAIEYAAKDYVVNYLIANSNFFMLLAGDPAQFWKTDIATTMVNIGKRLAKDIAPGLDTPDANKESYKQVFLEDRKNTVSNRIEYLEKLLGVEGAKAYRNINGTDAQEFTTLQEHIHLLNKYGQLTDEDYISILNKYNKNQDLDLRELSLVLQPMKPVYVENIIDIDNDINRTIYIKSSAFPLIKQLTNGLEIDKLRQAMENAKDGGIQRAVFKSGVKVGGNQFVNIWNKDGTIKDNIDLNTSFTLLPRTGFRIQQEVPFDENKSSIVKGTQETNLLFSNILDIPEMKQLSDEYNSLHHQLYQESYQSILEELTTDGELNIDKLRNTLIREAENRNWGLNDLVALKSIRTNAEDKFEFPLWATISADKIESLLNSLIDNKVRKQKMPGFSGVLASEEGFIGKAIKSNIVLLDGYDPEKGLQSMREENGVIKPAQVFAPFKLKDNNGKLLNIEDFIVDNEDGKKYIDTTKISPDLLKLFGYRIPTQGHNSMSYMEIVGFLPYEMGDLLITPRDFTIQMGSDFDIDKLYVYQYNTEYTDGKLNRYIGEGTKDIQNKILDVHFNVLSNTNKDIQSQIHQALDTPILEDLAKIYNDNTKKYITLLSDEYQKKKYIDATAGKMGVGVFSLDSVFNTIIQGKDIDLYEETPIIFDEGTGNKLSDPYTIFGRLKSEVISNFQSAAVDDEAKQVLEKLNINRYTFDAIRSLAQSGFEEEHIVALITQPIIKEYVELMKTSSDSLSDEFINDARQTIVSNLTEKYNKKEFKNISEDRPLSIQELTQDKNNIETQLAALSKFNKASRIGEEIQKVQIAINTYSKGLGKNLFESFDKEDKVKALIGNTKLTNVHSLLGNYTEDTLSTPTTINGFAAFFALLPNNRLWSKFFPYKSPSVSKVFSEIESITGRQLSAEDKRDVWLEVKAYLYTKVMSKDIVKERERLFKGNELVKRTKEFSKTLKGKHNPFIKRLKYGNNFLPEYNAAAGENKDELDVYHGLVQMLIDPEVEVKKLGEDLILGSLLSGGIQEARQYYKYIPNQYLINIGFANRLSNLDFNDESLLGPRFNNSYYNVVDFTKQYIQNNPYKARFLNSFEGLKYNPKEKTITIVDQEKANHILDIGKDREAPDLSLPTEFIFDPKKGLFQYQGNGEYLKIPVLSKDFMLNYNGQISEIDQPKSSNKDIREAETKKYTNPLDITNDYLYSGLGLTSPVVSKEIFSNITYANSSPLHKSLAEEIYKNYDKLELNKVKLVVSNEYTNGAYNNRTNTIYINNNIDSLLQLEKTFLHEVLHALLNKVLRNPVTQEQKNIKASLETLRKKVLSKIESDPELKKRYDKLVKELKSKKDRLDVSEHDIEELYGATNLEEFVTNIMTEPKFQLLLNSIPFDGNRESMYQRFANLVKKFLNSVGFEIKSNSVLEKGIEDIINLMNLPSFTPRDDSFSFNPEDDIPDGVLSLLPKAKKDNKYDRIIEEREKRIDLIERNIVKEDNLNKKEKLIELRDKLENEIENFKEETTFNNIIEFIENDKQEVKELLSQPTLSDYDLKYVDTIVHNLENYLDYVFVAKDLKPGDDGNVSPKVIHIQELLKEINGLRTELTELQLSSIVETINKINNSDLSLKDILQEFTSDIDVFQANIFNISRVDNVLAQSLYRLMLDQQNSTKDEVREVADSIDKIDEKMKNTSEFKQMGWKLFHQLDESGNTTGRLVNFLSDKFYKHKEGLYKKAIKSKNWKEYFNFIQENETIFDVRKLYNTEYITVGGTEYTTEEIDKYKEELKSIVGNRRYEEIIKSIDKKVQNYLDKYSSALNRYSTEPDPIRRTALIEKWEKENSPFYYSEFVEKKMEYKKGEVIPKGYKFTYSIPLREKDGVETGFYDKNFDIIQNNEVLYDYYKTYVNTINELSGYLPSNIKEDIPYNFIPSMKRTLMEEFSEKGYKGAFNAIWDGAVDSLTDYQKSEELKLSIGMIDNIPVDERSSDLSTVLKVYAMSTISYKYKSEISDTVDLFKHAVDNIIERKLDKEGANTNYNHLKQAIDHKVKTFYGKGRKVQGLTDYEISNSKGENKKFSFGKVGERLIWWTTMKGLAWNPFSAITDGMISTVNHLVHGAGGEDFSLEDYFEAKKIMLNTVGGEYYNEKMYNKIHKLVEYFGVEDNIYDTINSGSSSKNKVNSTFNWLMPMEIRKRIEFQNRGTTFISMLLNDNNTITDKEGNKIRLYDAFDEEGNWKTNLFTDEVNNKWNGRANENKSKKDFQAKLNQVVALMHGDYNPESGIRIKEGVLGRMLSVFRTWIPEGIAARFEEEKEDSLLKRKRKGRYRTFAAFYTKEGYSTGNVVSDTLNLVKALLIEGGRKGLTEVDAANMRKNFAELSLYMSIYAACILVKALDDDDEEGANTYFANFLMNQAFRIQTDITFYSSPISIETLQRSAVPPLSTLSDLAKFFDAAAKFIYGEDEIPTGIYAHESRLLRSGAKLFPGGFAFYRNRDVLERQIE